MPLWVSKDPSFLHVDSKDSNQTGRMPRLNCVFAGRTCHFVGFFMRRLRYFPEIAGVEVAGIGLRLADHDFLLYLLNRYP